MQHPTLVKEFPAWPLIEGFRRMPSRSELDLYEQREPEAEERVWLDHLLAAQGKKSHE
jgi:hypothetical protein